MDPLGLYIENFCGYGKCFIDFSDIKSAIIIAKINGSDKLSNGAGKTTIFSAIKYVLFNKVDASTLDKVIRHGETSCRVVFDFLSPHDNEIYRISRITGKVSEVRLFKKENDAWTDLTQRRNFDTKKEIAKIIKINYDTFCNSVLFSQLDLNGLASANPADRKKILKSALQLDVYSKYEKAAKKRTADLIKEIDKQKTIFSTIGEPDKDVIKYKKELDLLKTNIDEENKKLIEFKSLYDDNNAKHLSLVKEFEEIKSKKELEISSQQKLNIEIKNIKNIINEYDTKISSVGSSGKIIAYEIKEINNFIEKNDNIKNDNKENIDDIVQLLSDKKAKFKASQSEMEDLKIPMPKGSICKCCRQPISDQARGECQKSIDDKIESLTKELISLQKEIKELDYKYNFFKENVKKYENIKKQIENKKIELAVKEKEIENKRNLHKEYDEVLKRNYLRLKEKQEEYKNIVITDDSKYKEIYKKITDIKLIINDLLNNINNINKSIMSCSNNIAVIESKIEQRNKDFISLSSLNSLIADLSNKYVIHQKVSQAFGSAGIPALITHTILDDFQLEANNYLSQLRPGLQLQFNVIKNRNDGDQEDTLNIDFMLNAVKLEFAQLSGAQKLIVSLSLKLGLSSVIKKRLGVEIKFLMIDEVDQSLDEGGLEAFEDAIKKLQNEFKVFVITHNNNIKEKFDRAILVEQDENQISTAKTVSEW